MPPSQTGTGLPTPGSKPLPEYLTVPLRLLIYLGIARIIAMPFQMPEPHREELATFIRTVANGDDIFVITSTVLLITLACQLRFDQYLVDLKDDPVGTIAATIKYVVLPVTPEEANILVVLYERGVEPLMISLYRRIQSKAEEQVRAEVRAEARAEAKEERTELLDQLVREGILTPEQRAKKEAQYSNHGRE